MDSSSVVRRMKISSLFGEGICAQDVCTLQRSVVDPPNGPRLATQQFSEDPGLGMEG